MIKAKCSTCDAELPRRETLTVRNRILCEPCTAQFIEQYGATMKQDDVVRNVDPTICHWCNSDAGSDPQGEVAALPICKPCEERLRNWPFPAWIKATFAVLVILGIGSFIFNWRHVEGYMASVAAAKALATGQLDVARAQAKIATQKVPEFPGYRFIADLTESIHLMTNDQSVQALEILRKLDAQAPGQQAIQGIIADAEIAVAFDSKEYDRLLELTKQSHASHHGDRQRSFQLASAYACKYAETGDDEFKQAADAQLDALGADQSPEETDYRQRILHRIATRKIIDRKQFKIEFPNGWKPEG